MRTQFLKKCVGYLLAVLLLAGLFLFALHRLEDGHSRVDTRQLELTLRRAATACYAADGQYPMSLEELCQRFGIQYDETKYTVHFEAIASNLMPDITVVNLYE